jgi:Spy/CpxP family protein refolding chaperone
MPLAEENGPFDEVKVRAIADKQAAILAQLLVERQRLISKIYNDVLTPEQRTKADELRKHMHESRGISQRRETLDRLIKWPRFSKLLPRVLRGRI